MIMTDLKFNPTYNKVVIEIEKEKEVTAGGLYIPNMAKSKPITAKVVATGPGRYENGVLIPCCVNVGDRVMFSKMIGMPFNCDGKDYLTIPDAEIVCKIADDAIIEESTIFELK